MVDISLLEQCTTRLSYCTTNVVNRLESFSDHNFPVKKENVWEHRNSQGSSAIYGYKFLIYFIAR